MGSLQIVFLVLVFGSASIAAKVVIGQMSSKRVRQRLQAVDVANDVTDTGNEIWKKIAVQISSPFAKLSSPQENFEESPLRLRFINAGYRNSSAPIIYFGAKTLLAFGLPLIFFLLIATFSTKNLTILNLMLILFSVAAVGYYLPNIILSRIVMLRQRDIFENFADAADLMLVCVEAGLGLDSALNRVADEMRLKNPSLADELQLVNLEMRAGSSREKALRSLALRTGVEEVHTFATMLVQADRFGTSVGDSLRVFSDELRTRRRFRAEELAAKIPLKLLFPLVFCIFPSLLLVMLGPAFIQVYRVLVPTLSGTQ